MRRKQVAIRNIVAGRAKHRCEYCLTPDDATTGTFEIEHIEPTGEGGADELPNLAWACIFCNGSKNAATQAIDPMTGDSVALFHPRHDTWSEHFAWGGSKNLEVIGLSATGRATIARLRLNRLERMVIRDLLTLAGRHPPLDTPPPPAIP